VDVAGPFKFESKPYAIAAQSRLVLAAEDKTGSGVTAPAETAPAETAPETIVGEVEVPTTVGGDASPRLVWLIGGLAVIAAGFAIYKQKV
jgi:hypothetical protein